MEIANTHKNNFEEVYNLGARGEHSYKIYQPLKRLSLLDALGFVWFMVSRLTLTKDLVRISHYLDFFNQKW